MSTYHYGSQKTDSSDENPDRTTTGIIAPAPEPGTEVVGPAMFDLVREVKRAQRAQTELLRESVALMTRDRTIVEKTSFTLSAGGIGDGVIYRVPMGMEVVITRINIEGADVNNMFTPITPFVGGYIALFEGQSFTDPTGNRGGGELVDFIPNPATSTASPIIPAVITDGASEAGVFKGGQIISLHVQNGPANGTIWVRMQGILRGI